MGQFQPFLGQKFHYIPHIIHMHFSFTILVLWSLTRNVDTHEGCFYIVCVIYICVLEHDMHIDHGHFIEERDHEHFYRKNWLFLLFRHSIVLLHLLAALLLGRGIVDRLVALIGNHDIIEPHRVIVDVLLPLVQNPHALLLLLGSEQLWHPLHAYMWIIKIASTKSTGCFLTHIVFVFVVH